MLTSNSKITGLFGNVLQGRREEGADIIQVVLIAVVLIAMIIAAFNILSPAVTDQSTSAAECMQNAGKLVDDNNTCGEKF